MRTTIRDIAKRVGVSNSLVSLYLNNRPLAARIAESTKRKIDEAVKELNYNPSATARALKNGKSKTLGLVTAKLCSDYGSFFAQTLLDECSRQGYQLLIGITHFNAEEERRALENLISRQADGIFYTLKLFPADYLNAIGRNDYPILQLNSENPEFNSAALGLEDPLKEVARKIRELGCRRILVPHQSWSDILEKELAGYGVEIVGGRSRTTSDAENFQFLKDLRPDAVAADSSIYIKLLRRKCRELGLPTPYLFYNYALPCDYIDDPAIIGVTVCNFKHRLSGIVHRMIQMLEHPGAAVLHTKDPIRVMNPDELRTYHQSQLADPFYEPLVSKLNYEEYDR